MIAKIEGIRISAELRMRFVRLLHRTRYELARLGPFMPDGGAARREVYQTISEIDAILAVLNGTEPDSAA